jgi:hypothetical protein
VNTPSNPKRFAERIASVLFIGVLISLVWLTHTSASKIEQSPDIASPLAKSFAQNGKTSSECPTCSPAKERTIYAPLIDLPEASGSEIVLNSRSNHDLPITPVFYTLEGAPFTGDAIILHPEEIRFVDTKSLIPATERNQHKWGGMAFTYDGGFMEAWAQLTLHGIRGGGSVNTLFTVLSQKRSNTAEAVWWTPRGGSAVIALGNSADQPVHANLIFSTGESQTVDVAPFGTEIVRLHADLLGAASTDRVEAVSINYTGIEGSLIPTGYTASDKGKFASMIRFYDTQHVVQQNLFANNLRLKNTTPHMVLRNVSADFVSVSPTFLPASGDSNAAVKFQPVRLAPSETVEVNLSPLLKAASGRSDLDSVSVQISNSGLPGSVVGALYSIDPNRGVAYDVPLRDSGPPRASTGVYPVRLDGDYTTVITIANTTKGPGDFTLQFNFDGGHYVTGIIHVAPGATKTFDVRKIRDEQRPDVNGHPLPADLKIAQARWSMRGNVRLNGRSEVVSTKDQVSSSYSCFACCPYSFGAGWIAPQYYSDCPSATAGDTHQFIAWEQDVNGMYCGGNAEPYPIGAYWESSDECVATVDSSGLATALTGGYTDITCYWDTYSWFWDDMDESCDESEAPYEAGICFNVGPHINSISPTKGGVGQTVSVAIFGAGFSECGSNSISISGSGVSAADVSFISTGVLSANFQIQSDASAGNHSVTVYSGGLPSNSVNFFVQAPSSFVPISLSNANLGCEGTDVGYGGQVLYRVLDQNGQNMSAAGYTPQEHFTVNGTDRFPGFLSFATPRTTDSDGRFLDTPVGSCFAAPSFNGCADIVQTFNIVVGTVTYTIPTVTTRRDCVQGIRVIVTNGGSSVAASLGTVN